MPGPLRPAVLPAVRPTSTHHLLHLAVAALVLWPRPGSGAPDGGTLADSAAPEVPAPPSPPPGDPKPPVPEERARASSPPEMESLQLVLLRRGPSWTPDETPRVREIQAAHLAHLRRMAESGRMVVAGPFSRQADPSLRGLCLYRVATPAEARALAEQDPAVRSGRLVVDVMTWWFQKGAVSFPLAPLPR